MILEAVTLAYNDETTIGATIKCLKPFVKRHYVMLSERPYFGDPSKPDRTEEICNDLGAVVIKGFWELDHFQRNAGMSLTRGSDWVFTFDSDELITPDGVEDLVRFAEKSKEKAILNCPEVYWSDTDYVLSPKSTYSPPIMCKPSVRFDYIRNISCPTDTWEGTMHHLSWSAPKDIRKKVLNYAHASDFKNAEDWYYKEFTTWEYPKPAKMPDGSEYSVQYQPLPTELAQLL